MSEEILGSSPQSRRESAAGSVNWAWLLVALIVYIATLFIIRPEDYVDTFDYAKNIVDHSVNPARGQEDPFWNFGHLAWRPAGYVVWKLFTGPLTEATGLFRGDKILAAGAALVALNIAGGIACIVFLFLLLNCVLRNPKVSTIVTVGFLSTNAVLYYGLTGMSYLAGLAFQIAAMYFIAKAVEKGQNAFSAGVMPGLLLGCSILFWFPYVLTIPGVLCFAALLRHDSQIVHRVKTIVAGTAASTSAFVAFLYGAVALFLGMRDWPAFAQWIARSRYDKVPNRGILRMIGAIPRAFLSLGQGSTEWKRALFSHGSFSPLDFFRTGLWKVALVYAIFAIAIVGLRRSAQGRLYLICLFVAALPLAIFAAFLFEAGPPERYIAIFPLLYLGFAWVMADHSHTRFTTAMISAFFACAMLVNVTSLLRFRETAAFEAAGITLQQLNQRATLKDCIIVQSYQDDSLRMVGAQPFNPLSRIRYIFYPAVPSGVSHPEKWRQRLSARVEDSWKNGGRAWMTHRFSAERPNPDWGWIDGDVPGITWGDFHSFYKDLEFGDTFGGLEGFSEISRTIHNQVILDRELQDN